MSIFCYFVARLQFPFIARACLKKAFRELRVPVCGRFYPNKGGVAGYVNRMRVKYTAKWSSQIAEMIFQTRSTAVTFFSLFYSPSAGSSISLILRMWRSSLENGVSRNVSTILIASPGPTTLPPSASTFASLCSLVACAQKQSVHYAARIPGTLLAAIEIPIPVPQIRIPFSHSPSTMACATFLA